MHVESLHRQYINYRTYHNAPCAGFYLFMFHLDYLVQKSSYNNQRAFSHANVILTLLIMEVHYSLMSYTIFVNLHCIRSITHRKSSRIHLSD